MNDVGQKLTGDLIQTGGVKINGVVTPISLQPKIFELYHRPTTAGLTTGWESVDDFYRIADSEITVITGIPSHGKSSFMDALMLKMCDKHQWKWSVFSPENYPIEKHVRKLVEIQTGKTFSGQYNTEKIQSGHLAEAVEWMDERFKFVFPEEDSFNIEYILAKVRECSLAFKTNGFVLDPYNEFSHTRPASISETEYVSRFLGAIRRFCADTKLHAFIVAHPTKMQKNDSGGYDPPTAYDIAGSANWYNKADNIISIWRDKAVGNKHGAGVYSKN